MRISLSRANIRDFHIFFFFFLSLPLSFHLPFSPQNVSFQPPNMVIEQARRFQKVPIYTISFCYNDEVANGFLKELAALTGGEFHSYSFGYKDPCPPEAVQVRA